MTKIRSAMLLFAISTNANAFEAYVTNPGTRAMGMAGVFAAQADDSSAIWYNPGGLARANMVKRDYTVEWGGIPAAHAQRGFSDKQTFKFAGAYAGELWDKPTLGAGVAYMVPYQLSFDITQRVSPLSARTYGEITASYRQVSGLFAAQVRPDLAVGATLDWVWIGVECEQPLCVDYGPVGIGMSLGAAYDMVRRKDWAATLAAVWHSRAKLGYQSEPESGIGVYLGDYLPDRPQSLHLGAGLQIPGRKILWNTNVGIDRRWWSRAAGASAPADDFTRLGIAEEALIPLAPGRSLALRLGWAQARAEGGTDRVTTFSSGLGFSFAEHHAVDFAFERRVLKSAFNDEAQHVSLSYSWQR